ncbi:MAG: hypothetical protein KIT84_27765 [Labilithrix sp.]|nr:hypothetical protein [Labilithrix sp.]MCW5814857.1 hypothetical protein [Labilithrix sp.]
MRFASLLLALTGIVVACSSSNGAKPKTLCTPNKASYCRCQDREQGEKVCAADGNSYGPCIPCETFDNPEIPYDPSDPDYPPFGDDDDFDGGFEQPDDDGGGGAARCGDGKVQSGEDCDDGNDVDDDGCNGDCKLAGATAQATASCPGLAVHVWGGAHRPTLTSTTNGGGNHTSKTECSAAGSTATRGGATNDRTFKITAHKKGTLRVAVTATNYDAYVYAGDTCADDVVQKACANAKTGAGDETLQFAVEDGTSHTVIVDGKTGSAGNFKVTFSIE